MQRNSDPPPCHRHPAARCEDADLSLRPAASLTYPAVPGSSGADIIEKAGKDVVDLNLGERVIFDTKAYVDPQANRQVGHTVICTASPRSHPSLLALGASSVFDYKASDVLDQLRASGPFRYAMTASGDSAPQRAIAELLQPTGGQFASVLPRSPGGGLTIECKKSYTLHSHKRRIETSTSIFVSCGMEPICLPY